MHEVNGSILFCFSSDFNKSSWWDPCMLRNISHSRSPWWKSSFRHLQNEVITEPLQSICGESLEQVVVSSYSSRWQKMHICGETNNAGICLTKSKRAGLIGKCRRSIRLLHSDIKLGMIYSLKKKAVFWYFLFCCGLPTSLLGIMCDKSFRHHLPYLNAERWIWNTIKAHME